MTIEWRDIPGYEGYYKVSNTGLVKRVKAPKTKKSKQDRVLLCTLNSRGYKRCGLYKGEGACNFSVHTLVALAFIGPRPSGCDIHHMDGNKLNNTPGNLEYKLRDDHVSEHKRGELHQSHKLTERQVIEILNALSTGKEKNSEIALRFGVTGVTISDIKNKKTWKYISR